MWKNWGTENLKAAISSADYDRSKTAGVGGILQPHV